MERQADRRTNRQAHRQRAYGAHTSSLAYDRANVVTVIRLPLGTHMTCYSPYLIQSLQQGVTEQHSAMTIGFKVDANVKFHGLLMQELDSCWGDNNLNAQIVAHELGGGSIGICCLYYTDLQTDRRTILAMYKLLHSVLACGIKQAG